MSQLRWWLVGLLVLGAHSVEARPYAECRFALTSSACVTPAHTTWAAQNCRWVQLNGAPHASCDPDTRTAAVLAAEINTVSHTPLLNYYTTTVGVTDDPYTYGDFSACPDAATSVGKVYPGCLWWHRSVLGGATSRFLRILRGGETVPLEPLSSQVCGTPSGWAAGTCPSNPSTDCQIPTKCYSKNAWLADWGNPATMTDFLEQLAARRTAAPYMEGPFLDSTDTYFGSPAGAYAVSPRNQAFLVKTCDNVRTCVGGTDHGTACLVDSTCTEGTCRQTARCRSESDCLGGTCAFRTVDTLWRQESSVVGLNTVTTTEQAAGQHVTLNFFSAQTNPGIVANTPPALRTIAGDNLLAEVCTTAHTGSGPIQDMIRALWYYNMHGRETECMLYGTSPCTFDPAGINDTMSKGWFPLYLLTKAGTSSMGRYNASGCTPVLAGAPLRYQVPTQNWLEADIGEPTSAPTCVSCVSLGNPSGCQDDSANAICSVYVRTYTKGTVYLNVTGEGNPNGTWPPDSLLGVHAFTANLTQGMTGCTGTGTSATCRNLMDCAGTVAAPINSCPDITGVIALLPRRGIVLCDMRAGAACAPITFSVPLAMPTATPTPTPVSTLTGGATPTPTVTATATPTAKPARDWSPAFTAWWGLDNNGVGGVSRINNAGPTSCGGTPADCDLALSGTAPTLDGTNKQQGNGAGTFASAGRFQDGVVTPYGISGAGTWGGRLRITNDSTDSVVLHRKPFSTTGYELTYKTGTDKVTCYAQDKSAAISDTNTLNQFTFVACTWDGANLNAYGNGKAAVSTALTTLTNPGSGYFSLAGYNNATSLFVGQLDEVGLITTRALTEAEVCRWCACGIDGALCTCTGTAWTTTGLRATTCNNCTLPTLCNDYAPGEPTPTPTSTPTPTLSITPTVTSTPALSATPTVTETPTPTLTAPTPTATATTPPNLVANYRAPTAVDGGTGDYANGDVARISVGPDGQTGYGQYRCAWNESFLTCLGVTDDASLIAVGTDPTDPLLDDDSMELWLDTTHGRAATPQATDYRVLVNLNNVPRVTAGVSTALVTLNGFVSSITLHGALNVPGRTNGGYAIEWKLAWSDLGITPKSGLVLGLGFVLNNHDATSYSRTTWLGTYEAPNTWGTLTLGDIPPGVYGGTISGGQW